MRDAPRLGAYLAQLPAGLDSHPECTAKASVVRKVYEFARDNPLVGLPEPLQRLLDEPLPSSTWVPQAQVLAAIVAMVEARCFDPETEREWVRRAATHLFASSMYRILMWAATPRMVFKSAQIRWSAFFRGTRLESEVFERSARVRLISPDGLFNPDLQTIFAEVMYAAVNYTRDDASAASLVLLEEDPERIEYLGTW